MKYFNSLPTIGVTNKQGDTRLYRNLMTRLSMIPNLLNDPLVYYSYDIQEGDTPEIIAHKYYGNSYRYWIVLFSNQYLDPQWDWPLSSNQLNTYIQNKYENTGIDPYTDVKSYKKVITQYNVTDNTTTTNEVEISASDYSTLQPSQKSFSFSTGTVIVSISKKILNYNDYEIEFNESKRNIKLLKKDYVSQIESEFTKLLRK